LHQTNAKKLGYAVKLDNTNSPSGSVTELPVIAIIYNDHFQHTPKFHQFQLKAPLGNYLPKGARLPKRCLIIFRRGQELRRYLFEHPAGGCRFHDPAADFLPPQHHRHPGMNPTHGRVGLRGQNAVAALILPLIVDARQIKRLRIRQAEQVFSLIRAPLVKAAGGDDAAARLDTVTK